MIQKMSTTSDELDTSALTEDQKTMFDKAENFCKGEYEGDTSCSYNSYGR